MLAIAEPLPVVRPSCLAVTHLNLTAFRCYDSVRLDLDERPVMVTGPNGAGKTNLLEAVSFLAPGRGLRRARLAEADQRAGSRPWAVAARLSTTVGMVDIGTGHDRHTGRRVVHINGAPARGPIALAEYVSAVWLTPQMDRLFQEGAAARRRFLDRLTFGFHIGHATHVSAYEQVMRERLRLLREGQIDRSWLDALEEKMAEHGAAIAASRLEMAEHLNRACEAATGPFSGAHIDVDGILERWLEEGPALAVEEKFKETLIRNRGLDAGTGTTTVGPHKSDLIVKQIEKGLPASQCSTGEQKALLIAVLLANTRLQASERRLTPLLLLDEAVAHLDPRKRSELYNEILELGAQAWFSGTDEKLFSEFGGNAQFVRIIDGTIQQYQTHTNSH